MAEFATLPTGASGAVKATSPQAPSITTEKITGLPAGATQYYRQIPWHEAQMIARKAGSDIWKEFRDQLATRGAVYIPVTRYEGMDFVPVRYGIALADWQPQMAVSPGSPVPEPLFKVVRDIGVSPPAAYTKAAGEMRPFGLVPTIKYQMMGTVIMPPEKTKAQVELAKLKKDYVEIPGGLWIKKEDLKKLSPYLRELIQTQGMLGLYVAYGKAMAEKTKLKRDYIALPDDMYIRKEDFEALPDRLKNIAKKSGVTGLYAELENFDKAKETLKDYKTKDGEYDIVKALVSDNKQVSDAVYTLFKDQPEVIKEVERYIDENFEPQWKATEFSGIPYKISKFWRKLTPWKEEAGETISSVVPDVITKFFEERKVVDYPKSKLQQKVIDAAEWIDEKYMPFIQQGQDYIREELAKPETVKYIEKGQKKEYTIKTPTPMVGALMGVVDIAGTIPATIAGVLSSSFLQFIAKNEKEAVIGPALLLAGMADWFVGRPMSFKKDPAFEIPYTIVLLRGSPVKEMVNVAKAAKIALDPRMVSNTAFSLQADIPKAKLPGKMTEFKGRYYVEAVSNIWGGKDKVPAVIKKMTIPKQSIHTLSLKGRDMIIKDKDGKVIGKVTPFQRVVPQGGFHAAGDLTLLINDLTSKGYFETKPIGAYGGFWISQQYPQTFMTRGGGIKKPGGVMVRFSAKKDLKEIPPEILDLPNFKQMKIAMETYARQGNLEPGIYPVFKYHKGSANMYLYELEFFVAPKFRFYATKPTWYATKEGGTAHIKTTSMVNLTDPKTKIQIKEGDTIPMLIVASKAAAAEGMGVPPLSQFYMAEALRPFTAIKKWLPWRIRFRQRLTGEEGITTGSRFMSTYSGLELKGPKVAEADAIAKLFFEDMAKQPARTFTNADAARLGEIFDSGNKYIIKAREPYQHPKIGGLVTSRVTGIIVQKDAQGKITKILLVNDKSEPVGVYGLPGGQIDPMGKLPRRTHKGISPEEALEGQILSELGIELRNIQRLPVYQGKVTDHAMLGSYIFIAEAKSPKISLTKYQPKGKQTEIRSYKWITPNAKLKVFAPTVDILKIIKDFDISGLKATRYGTSIFRKARDKNYASRLIYRNPQLVSKIMDTDIRRRALEKEAEIEANAQRSWQKGEDFETALLAERVRAADQFYNDLFAKDGEIAKWLKECEKLLDYEEKYGQVAYKPVKGDWRVLGIMEDGKYRVYKPKYLLEYVIKYPQLLPQAYKQAYAEVKTINYPTLQQYPNLYKVPPHITPYLFVTTTKYQPPPTYLPEIPPPKRPPYYPPLIPPIKIPAPKERIIATRERELVKFEPRPALEGMVTWRQGALKHGGKLKDVWWVIRYPYKSKANVEVIVGKPPAGAIILKGPGSAYKTIQKLTGVAPDKLFLDLGIFDIVLTSPSRTPRRQAITYKRDIKQRTTGNITLKGVRVK